MRRRFSRAPDLVRSGLLLLLLALVPAPASAWGVAAHRYIMGRAIEPLPAGLEPFFTHYRDELVLRVNDPDTWRVAGWDEGPHHFVNFGRSDLGPYPFVGFPREYGAAVEKFGLDGQLTGQSGVHARFESALFERYQSKLTIEPVAIAPIANPLDVAFDTLLASHQLVPRRLRADQDAATGKAIYDANTSTGSS